MSHMERNDTYGHPDPRLYNNHLTQVLWRATTLVGCGEAIRWVTTKSGVTGRCRVSHCLYRVPGNCDIGRYKGKKYWEIPDVWKDSTGCRWNGR